MKQKIKITREQIEAALNALPFSVTFKTWSPCVSLIPAHAKEHILKDSIEVEVDVPEPKVVDEWISPTGFAVTEDSMKEVVGLFKESSKLDALEKRVASLESRITSLHANKYPDAKNFIGIIPDYKKP